MEKQFLIYPKSLAEQRITIGTPCITKKGTAWLLVKLKIKLGEIRLVSWKVSWDKRLVNGMATQQNRNRNLVAIIITQDSYGRHHEVDHRRTVKSSKDHLNKQQRRKAGWQFVKVQDYPAYGSKLLRESWMDEVARHSRRNACCAGQL